MASTGPSASRISVDARVQEVMAGLAWFAGYAAEIVL